MPQTWLFPALSRAKDRPPETRTGEDLNVPLPLNGPMPNVKLVLSPQQYAAPDCVSAHVKRLPLVICENVRPPATGTGVAPPTPFVPVPNCPRSLAPQQYAAPVVERAQEWSAPALTDANWTPAGASTKTGAVLQTNPPHDSVAEGVPS